ncbi:chemotaxis protein [Paenibacillus anaericanus]|uniref:Chemotaxis protein n=1 Tax=Paenibacillus anaericanus TaxID=170367 RepID=A0A433Y6M4_9BACL|nr:chemotaxis protein [Paenibacillus anaericanus]RUT44674.1 chemotaxis protein [Paenibacillus anaericanus]
MCRVGFVDDDFDEFGNYKKRLARRGIDLHFVDNCLSLHDILDWVLNNTIECLLVDHKLTAKYDFYGTKVVAFINNHLPDLPCIILTNFPGDSADDKLVMKNLIFDRNILSSDGEKFNNFCEIVKQSTEVFKNRLNLHLDEYAVLLEKKTNQEITAEEEETFLHLFKILKSYGEVDDVASELLKPDINRKMDNLLKKLDHYIDLNKE